MAALSVYIFALSCLPVSVALQRRSKRGSSGHWERRKPLDISYGALGPTES